MTQEQSAPPAPPQPTIEHERLKERAGVWDVDCTFFMDPTQPPMKVKGKETIEMFGQFWTTSLFKADMFGSPFQGRCTVGFDPQAGKYVSTWQDTMSPTFFHFTGQYDESGKVLEMTGEAYDCTFKQVTGYRTRDEQKSPDHFVLEMFATAPDGNEIKMFTHEYRRVR